MDTKLVKVISLIGNWALVNIDGQKVRAKVEGNIPSNVFWGEIINQDGRITIKVKDKLPLSMDLDRILAQLELPRNVKNYHTLKTLISFSLPINMDNYNLLLDVNLPIMLSSLIVKSRTKDYKKYLFLAEGVFSEYKDGKISDREFVFFVSYFLLQGNKDHFKIFWLGDEGERWFSYFEFDEEGKFKKFIMTTCIDDVEVLVVFERMIKGYSVSINLFSDVKIRWSSERIVNELKQNLQAIGFNPIYISIEVFGGSR